MTDSSLSKRLGLCVRQVNIPKYVRVAQPERRGYRWGCCLLNAPSAWRDGRVFALAQLLDRVVQVLLGLAERAIPLVATPFRAT